MRKINYYTKINGSKPVKEFVDSLEDKYILKIFWVMSLIRESKNTSMISAEYFKKLSSSIWEIRARVGRNAFRLLCFFDGNDLIITTNGFKKKTQKTPKQEIELAKNREKEYFERKIKNG